MLDSNRWPPYLSTILIILLPFLLFWRWLFKGEVLFWGTPLFQFWPWHYLTKTTALAGEWPLWNPLLGNGAPLLANLQSAVFYPPNLLYFLIPVTHGLTLSVILHLSLAGLLMYGYARQIELRPFAATVSAVTYMFSGYIIGRTQFVTMINALAWFPLLLLLGERLATQRNYRSILWLGLALAVQLLAGHAQLWFYGLWLVGAYILFRSWQEARHNIKGRQTISALLRGGVFLGLAVALAILLTAVQILPTVEFTTQSPRNSGAERAFALSYSFWPWRLITLLSPDFFGNPARGDYWGYATYWEDHAYIGALPFMLAVIAIWFTYRPTVSPTHKNPTAPFFAILALVGLILAMGWNTPIYLWVFDYIPGFGYFQAPSRLLIWYTIAMTILAGMGAQYFELTSASRRGWQRLLIVCLGITVAGLAGNFLLSGVNLTFLRATTSLGLLLTISIGLLLLRPARQVRPGDFNPNSTPVIDRQTSRWQVAVLIFIIVDLLWAAAPLIPTLPAAVFDQSIASADFLKGQPNAYRYFVDEEFEQAVKFNEYYRFDTFGPRQIAYWQGLRETLIPNVGVYARLPASNNDDPLVIGRWQRLIDLVQAGDPVQKARLLSLMNAGYFIDAASASSWPTIYDDGTITIQQVPDVLPRAYFVPRAYRASNEAEALARLSAADFDSHREVVIIINNDESSELRSQTKESEVTDFRAVVVNEQGPHQLTMSVDAPTSGFIVLTDTFYPGWQATVNGEPSPIQQANLAFRAVAVEAGPQEIVWRYQPRSFRVGLWISGAALLVTLIIIIIFKDKAF